MKQYKYIYFLALFFVIFGCAANIPHIETPIISNLNDPNIKKYLRYSGVHPGGDVVTFQDNSYRIENITSVHPKNISVQYFQIPPHKKIKLFLRPMQGPVSKMRLVEIPSESNNYSTKIHLVDVNFDIGGTPRVFELYFKVLEEQIPKKGLVKQADSLKPKSLSTLGSPPKIWLFSIGISEFKDKSMNLNYAMTDAKNFYRHFRSDSGGMLPKSQTVLLINKAATRAKVLQTLVRMVKQAHEKDLVIIFFATHGLPDADTGEINFLMHDTDPGNLIATGLSHRDINSAISRSRAKKILFIVDACHSGGLGTGKMLAQRGIKVSEVNRMISLLSSASDGISVLSASSSNEMSFEDEKWNGGVFTYYLIGGLKGRADKNQDQIVTLRELYDYVYDKVPIATKGKQHPELKGQFSNELPLIEVNP